MITQETLLSKEINPKNNNNNINNNLNNINNNIIIDNNYNMVLSKNRVFSSKNGGEKMSLQGIFEWIKEQAQYGLFIALIFLILLTGVKRAWIAMIGAVIGLAFVGIFILNPNIITNLAQWLGGRLNLGA